MKNKLAWLTLTCLVLIRVSFPDLVYVFDLSKAITFNSKEIKIPQKVPFEKRAVNYSPILDSVLIQFPKENLFRVVGASTYDQKKLFNSDPNDLNEE